MLPYIFIPHLSMKPIDNKLRYLYFVKDINAFKELYYRFYPILYNYGIKLIGDKETVEDCIHDLFIKLIQNHESLPSAEHLKYYLIKSFRNTIYDQLRKRKTTDDISKHENKFTATDLFSSLFENEYITDANTEYLKRVIKLLPSRQQEILYLYFTNGLKHKEIADILNINHQSSKNLLSRSLSKLRSLFKNRKKSEYQNEI